MNYEGGDKKVEVEGERAHACDMTLIKSEGAKRGGGEVACCIEMFLTVGLWQLHSSLSNLCKLIYSAVYGCITNSYRDHVCSCRES